MLRTHMDHLALGRARLVAAGAYLVAGERCSWAAGTGLMAGDSFWAMGIGEKTRFGAGTPTPQVR